MTKIDFIIVDIKMESKSRDVPKKKKKEKLKIHTYLINVNNFKYCFLFYLSLLTNNLNEYDMKLLHHTNKYLPFSIYK